MTTPTVVAGIGMSSAATGAEVERLLTVALTARGLDRHGVVLATRDRFVGDPRLPCDLTVVGVPDAVLVANSPDVPDRPGIPARVAGTAALLVAGGDASLLGPVERSAGVTLALALALARRPTGTEPPR